MREIRAAAPVEAKNLSTGHFASIISDLWPSVSNRFPVSSSLEFSRLRVLGSAFRNEHIFKEPHRKDDWFRQLVGGNESNNTNKRHLHQHHVCIQNDCSTRGIVGLSGCNVLLGPVGSGRVFGGIRWRRFCPKAITPSAGVCLGRTAIAAVRFDQPLPTAAVLQWSDVQAKDLRRYRDSSRDNDYDYYWWRRHGVG